MYLKTVHMLCALMMGILTLSHGAASAQDQFDQDWLLNPSLSNVYMQTVKANSIFETHQFTSVEGVVKKSGDASVKIELASLETGRDLRDVRMRFLFFEVFKFPVAEIKTTIDKSKLTSLATETRISTPISLTVSMHGLTRQLQSRVWITRIGDTTVSVATIKPIIVTAESFGFSKNITKLIEVIGGTTIAPAASITFDLVFSTGALTSKLVADRKVREKRRIEKASRTITTEECETRFTVISKTGAIYFKTGSAELDLESAPLLDSVADITNRCQSVSVDVAGHTDNVGTKSANQRLSERRAKSVVNYLTNKGVIANRIKSAGYGDTRPVAPNDTEENRAKNRRIVFKVNKS